MYTGTKKRDRSMKSWRLKIVALTWLQGGHQTAPQYKNTGLSCFFATAKAASTSPLYQPMPESSSAGFEIALLVNDAGAALAAVAACEGMRIAPAEKARATMKLRNRVFMSGPNKLGWSRASTNQYARWWRSPRHRPHIMRSPSPATPDERWSLCRSPMLFNRL